MAYDLSLLQPLVDNPSLGAMLDVVAIFALLAGVTFRRQLGWVFRPIRSTFVDLRRQIGEKRLGQRLLALITIGVVAATAELASWPSADLIVRQLLAVACYVVFSAFAAKTRSIKVGEWASRAALSIRWIVIIGGECSIATAPPSRSLAMIMAATMALAAGFMFQDWLELLDWDDMKKGNQR